MRDEDMTIVKCVSEGLPSFLIEVPGHVSIEKINELAYEYVNTDWGGKVGEDVEPLDFVGFIVDKGIEARYVYHNHTINLDTGRPEHGR